MILKRIYRLFYKWEYRALRELGDLGENLYKKLVAVSVSNTKETVFSNIKKIVAILINEIIKLGLTFKRNGNFLQNCGFAIEESIYNKILRSVKGYIE